MFSPRVVYHTRNIVWLHLWVRTRHRTLWQLWTQVTHVFYDTEVTQSTKLRSARVRRRWGSRHNPNATSIDKTQSQPSWHAVTKADWSSFEDHTNPAASRIRERFCSPTSWQWKLIYFYVLVVKVNSFLTRINRVKRKAAARNLGVIAPTVSESFRSSCFLNNLFMRVLSPTLMI